MTEAEHLLDVIRSSHLAGKLDIGGNSFHIPRMDVTHKLITERGNLSDSTLYPNTIKLTFNDQSTVELSL